MGKCNLGGYKTLVVVANKCGGPLPFVLELLAVGYGFGKVVEIGKDTVKKRQDSSERTYLFSKPGFINNMQFEAGEQFSIIITIKDVALIKLQKECKIPQIVSLKYLKTVSSDLAADLDDPSKKSK